MTDFADWSAGVNVVDRSAQIFGFTPPTQLIANGIGQVVACDQWNTVHCVISLPGGAGVQYYTLLLQWLEAGQQIDSDGLSFHNENAYALSPTTLYAHFPARGSFVEALILGTDNQGINFKMVGSSRSLSVADIARDGDIGQRLVQTGNLALAAGASQTLRVPPVSRAYAIDIGDAITSGTVEIKPVRSSGVGPPGPLRSHLFATNATTGLVLPELVMPQAAMDIVVTNNDAVVRNGTYWVWDVS